MSNDSFGSWSRIFTDLRQCAAIIDWFTCNGTTLVGIAQPNNNSVRVDIDRVIVGSQIPLRIRDSYLALYRDAHGSEAPSARPLSIVETGFGVFIPTMASYSLSLEMQEGPPFGTADDVWASLVSTKFIQNSWSASRRPSPSSP